MSTATAVKLETLDQLVASTLSANEEFSAEFLGLLLGDVVAEIARCDQTSKEGRAASIDPTRMDGASQRSKAEDAEFCAYRLRAGEEKLKQLLVAAVQREERDAWDELASPVRQRVTDTAKELATTYEECVKKLLDIFKRVNAVDQEVASLNSAAPRGVGQLCGVEQRIGGGAKIIERVRLPWSNGGTVIDLWPPKSQWQQEYAASVATGLQRMPPTDAERAAASARHVAYGEADEREHQRLNAEAAARAEANAAELRRQRAGELPRG